MRAKAVNITVSSGGNKQTIYDFGVNVILILILIPPAKPVKVRQGLITQPGNGIATLSKVLNFFIPESAFVGRHGRNASPRAAVAAFTAD